MNTLTVTPFLLALIVGLAAMPTDIVKVGAWGLGHEHTQAWRQRSNGLSRVRQVLRTCFGGLSPFAIGCLALLAVCAVAECAFGAHGHRPGVFLAMAAAGGVVEPSLAEVKSALDDSNRLFQNEFKEVRDKIKSLEEKGAAVDPLLKESMDKINAALDKHSELNDAFIAMQAKHNRQNLTVVTGDAEEKRAVALRDFNRTLKSHAVANGRQVPGDMEQKAYDEYAQTFENYLRRGDRNFTDVERRALSVGTDPQGGYVVTPDLTGRMVERMFETSPMRQYASVQAISTDTLEGVSDLDEASFGWVSELGTRSDSNTPNVPAPWRIPVHEAYSKPKASQKLLEDANIDVVAWLGKKVGDKIGRGFNTAFVTGTGIGRPRGFASYTTAATADASRAWGTFEHVGTGSNGSFGTDPNGVQKLLTMIHKLKDGYTVRAAFYMNRTTLGGVRQLTDASSAGKFVFIPSFIAGQPDTLLGYPVRKLQDMDDYTTTAALAVAFGDMQETYQIVDRLGITVLVDPYTDKPYVVFYTRARVGGDVLNFDSMKFLKFS